MECQPHSAGTCGKEEVLASYLVLMDKRECWPRTWYSWTRGSVDLIPGTCGQEGALASSPWRFLSEHGWTRLLAPLSLSSSRTAPRLVVSMNACLGQTKAPGEWFLLLAALCLFPGWHHRCCLVLGGRRLGRARAWDATASSQGSWGQQSPPPRCDSQGSHGQQSPPHLEMVQCGTVASML